MADPSRLPLSAQHQQPQSLQIAKLKDQPTSYLTTYPSPHFRTSTTSTYSTPPNRRGSTRSQSSIPGTPTRLSFGLTAEELDQSLRFSAQEEPLLPPLPPPPPRRLSSDSYLSVPSPHASRSRLSTIHSVSSQDWYSESSPSSSRNHLPEGRGTAAPPNSPARSARSLRNHPYLTGRTGFVGGGVGGVGISRGTGLRSVVALAELERTATEIGEGSGYPSAYTLTSGCETCPSVYNAPIAAPTGRSRGNSRSKSERSERREGREQEEVEMTTFTLGTVASLGIASTIADKKSAWGLFCDFPKLWRWFSGKGVEGESRILNQVREKKREHGFLWSGGVAALAGEESERKKDIRRKVGEWERDKKKAREEDERMGMPENWRLKGWYAAGAGRSHSLPVISVTPPGDEGGKGRERVGPSPLAVITPIQDAETAPPPPPQLQVPAPPPPAAPVPAPVPSPASEPAPDPEPTPPPPSPPSPPPPVLTIFTAILVDIPPTPPPPPPTITHITRACSPIPFLSQTGTPYASINSSTDYIHIPTPRSGHFRNFSTSSDTQSLPERDRGWDGKSVDRLSLGSLRSLRSSRGLTVPPRKSSLRFRESVEDL